METRCEVFRTIFIELSSAKYTKRGQDAPKSTEKVSLEHELKQSLASLGRVIKKITENRFDCSSSTRAFDNVFFVDLILMLVSLSSVISEAFISGE